MMLAWLEISLTRLSTQAIFPCKLPSCKAKVCMTWLTVALWPDLRIFLVVKKMVLFLGRVWEGCGKAMQAKCRILPPATLRLGYSVTQA